MGQRSLLHLLVERKKGSSPWRTKESEHPCLPASPGECAAIVV